MLCWSLFLLEPYQFSFLGNEAQDMKLQSHLGLSGVCKYGVCVCIHLPNVQALSTLVVVLCNLLNHLGGLHRLFLRAEQKNELVLALCLASLSLGGTCNNKQ